MGIGIGQASYTEFDSQNVTHGIIGSKIIIIIIIMHALIVISTWIIWSLFHIKRGTCLVSKK